MIDSSIFLESYDETDIAGDCKILINGAKSGVYLGNVSTIILGEITKKLLNLKKEAPKKSRYRYEDIYEGIMKDLLNFKIQYVCDETLDIYRDLNIRGTEKSQDKINLACAIANKCNLLILKDSKFTYNKKGHTQIVQITEDKNKKLKNLLDEIKLRQPVKN